MTSFFGLLMCFSLCAVVILAYRELPTQNIFRGLEKLRKRQTDGITNVEQPCFYIQQLEALKAQFRDYIDSNDDGKATYPEVKRYLQKYNPSVTNEQIEEFLTRRDVDGDGEVDFIPDYLSEVMSNKYSMAKAREWFKLEDTNKDGFVSKDELIKIAVNIGMTPAEAEETAMSYYMAADENGDEKLDWNEYSKLFLQ